MTLFGPKSFGQHPSETNLYWRKAMFRIVQWSMIASVLVYAIGCASALDPNAETITYAERTESLTSYERVRSN